ncbi:DUF6790 family protein [Segnochrobactraceae bacterium EtOH-i3]
MVTLVPILTLAAAFVFAIVACWISRPVTARKVVDRLIRGLMLFPIGLEALWAALGHIAFAEQSAAAIGWAPSPFQFEVGVANLGIGVAGVIGALVASRGYQWGVTVVTAGFLGGAGVGHLVQISETGNMAAGNAGPILYTDFATPGLTAALLLVACFLTDRRAA